MNQMTLRWSGAAEWEQVDALAAGASAQTLTIHDETQEALRLRKAWMRKMGLAAEEIAVLSQATVPSLQLEAEKKNLEAAEQLGALTPNYDTLRARLGRRKTT
jgi:hypothetical protein